MRILSLGMGSRGDVQPFIAAAVGLQRAGHDVTMATHDEFAPLVAEHGLRFHSIGADPRAMLEGKVAEIMLQSGRNGLQFLRLFAKVVGPFTEGLVRESLKALENAEGLVLSSLLGCAHMMSRPGVPYCAISLQPLWPTAEFESLLLPQYPPWLPLGRAAYNRWSHRASAHLFWWILGRQMLRAQVKLGGRAPTRRERQAALERRLCYAFSPSLIPRPVDWPANAVVTGYLFLDRPAGWQPPAEVASFLAAGPPPVYIGFGSMRSRDPEATARLAIEALALTGQRGILHRGWGGLEQAAVPDNVLLVDSLPHDWLLPRMAAVVHHGGAGTTAAGLRAGVPSIVVPHFADQPFWARRVHLAGVGPAPILRRRLTADRLAEAIRQAVTDREMQRRARELGRRIQAEDGVGQAVRVIEEEMKVR